MMKVVVRYFASFKDAVGTEREEVVAKEGVTVIELLDQLIASHPGLAGGKDLALFSINLEFADRHSIISDGDEVGVFPPMSGG
jgi:molybdopterin converting factor subunit 1